MTIQAVSGLEAEAKLGEKLDHVLVFRPDGTILEIERAEIVVLDLGNLAVAWKRDGKIHRAIGLPLETISEESRIVAPA